MLVAEDEPRLADTVARGLRREGIAVDLAGDGEEALFKARLFPYDVVVLDRDLPALHGDEVCRALSGGSSEARILMLTASAGLDELVSGLALGADDYLSKPFRFAELVARIGALARRAGPARPATLVVGDLTLDPARKTVTRFGRPVELTRKEFGVLEELMGAQGGVVRAEQLLARVWDENADPFSNTARMAVMTLRRKLGDPPLIETLKGQGYRL